MDLYYIFQGDEKEGPYDMVTLIRRIRNGKLTRDTWVQSETMDAPVQAEQVDILSEYFNELNETPEAEPHKEKAKTEQTETAAIHIDLRRLLTDGWALYSSHQSASIYVGMGSLFILAFGMMCSAILPASLAILLTSALTGVLLNVFMIFIHYRYHNREIDERFVAQFKKGRGIHFLLLNAAISIPCLAIPAMMWLSIGPLALLFLLLGCFGFSLFLFAPLIWMDEPDNHDYISMMMRSMRKMTALDMDNLGKLLSVFALNLIALSVFLFPIFIVLPVTSLAYTLLYEEQFKHNI